MVLFYKITNSVNTLCYVGSTKKTLKQRWAKHIAKCRERPTRKLYKAFLELGVDKFKIEQIASIDEENQKKILALELSFIEQFDSLLNGYNTRRPTRSWLSQELDELRTLYSDSVIRITEDSLNE